MDMAVNLKAKDFKTTAAWHEVLESLGVHERFYKNATVVSMGVKDDFCLGTEGGPTSGENDEELMSDGEPIPKGTLCYHTGCFKKAVRKADSYGYCNEHHPVP